jgi:hypothetical protein
VITKIRWGWLLALLVLVAPAGRRATAQSEGTLYFPETGHWVTGEFLALYEDVPEPLEQYGVPITDAFPEPGSDRLIQYFQKARFVLEPQTAAPLRVQRSPLGELLYSPGIELRHSPSFPACRTFSETGFEVCYAFLDFFNANGGVVQFGYPISNFESHAGLIAQYFQRARFEWHPELPPGQRVTLGDLGREYFEFAGEDPLLLFPNLEDNLPQSIIELRVQAFPGESVMPHRGTQTLYVIVQDQNFRPVSNVEVEFSVRLPNGQPETYSMPPTDENGVSSATFRVAAGSTGIADVLVSARFDSFREQTRTSFRIWW